MAKRLARDRKADRGIKAAGRSIGPVLRLFGVAAIGCLAAGTVVLMYPTAEEAPTIAARAETPKATASLPKAPEPIRAAAVPAPQPTLQTTGAVVQTPPPKPAAPVPQQTASVRAPPLLMPAPAAAPPAAATAYVPVAPAAPAPSPEPPPPATTPAQSPSARFAGAPVDCLSPDLVTVLREVQARFGPVTVVSGKELHTRNHSPGTARHKLHSECKAVDFTVAGKSNEVIAFLKARPEVNGVNSYRPNNLIHIDLNERRRLATR